ncbi:MAG: NAD(P)H-binding protein, partial [Anaerolineae bacterium]|nr:NAD(P)H-binding protein [Anaerolineae bacterium]
MPPQWMIYGATGYTGQLLAEHAVQRGHKPVLAGRAEGKLRPLAERLGLDWLAVSLEDEAALHHAVRQVNLVFHAAGPYADTAQPMLDACVAGITNYIDIAGDTDTFALTFGYD